ncbi:hypothetical protein [Flavobacterium sandaracinum]|uniref:Cell wall anchor protein n=1 Tax=Flavobacterium sandaracinum TaxID=2541733 RepID=A0A4R5D520_9FLAO|nr:hypothetical protein [Flavobacterium sandaracinum]TDE05203.1 hypothetical protein E0F91_06795 [Flavobacterium sandaracinum]
MKKNYATTRVLQACLLFFMIITTNVFGQVGIGTITPNASSVLDVSSTTQGMLTPRMTTAQRTAIASPADGLMVYDTDLKSFHYYNSAVTSWNVINSGGATDRLKFKRIKSTDVLATVLAAEKAAGGGSKYLLDSGTLYEINGQILMDLPIELNNAYIAGMDSGEDKLVNVSGDLFTGTTGGSIRVVTLVASGSGRKVFNITADKSQNLILRDCIVANSSSVGLISGFSLVFVSVVQFVANSNGIIYENITELLISNTGWFSNNSGTYEKLQGTFDLVQKQGGFSEVSGSSIGFDVSSNPTITGDAVIESVVFTGVTTGKYVNGYTGVGVYTGYNFNNKWNIRCPGIPQETDLVATGGLAFNYEVGFGGTTTFNSASPSNIVKVGGDSVASNLFRLSTDNPAVSNRLKYLGSGKRFFNVSGSISFQVSGASIYIIYVAKNGSTTGLTQYKVYGRGAALNDIVVVPINAIVELSNGDYVEVFAQKYSGPTSFITTNMTLILN